MKAHGLGLALSFAAAVACAAPLPFSVGPEAFDPKGGHIQGIAASEDALYVAQMTRLVKLDWKGDVLVQRAVQSHTGDIAWHDGELYAAVAVYPERKEGRIQVFDKDLNLVRETVIDRTIDGIAYADGVLYVGMGAKDQPSKNPHRVNIIGRFDAKTLKEIAPRAEFDYGYETKYGFQNIVFDGERFVASFYSVKGSPDVAFFDRNLKVLGTASAKCSQGFDILPPSMRSEGARFVRATTKSTKSPPSVSCAFDFFDFKTIATSKAQKNGSRIWWYICSDPKAPKPNVFVECPPVETRILMGAMTRKFRPDGFLYYSMGLWRNPRPMKDGPFTDWIVRNREWYHGDGCLTYCGPDGTPLASQHLENFRDGLEDLWYAKLLEERLHAVESGKLKVKSGGDADSKHSLTSWTERARKLLAVPTGVVRSIANFSTAPDVIYRWRDEMADLIEEEK